MRYEESVIQKVVVNWLRRNYPDVLFTCAPAVAKSARQGRENKLMGYCKGWPDLTFAEPRHGYPGLYVELKTATGKIQPEQEIILERLRSRGYKTVICRSDVEAISTIKEYLK